MGDSITEGEMGQSCAACAIQQTQVHYIPA